MKAQLTSAFLCVVFISIAASAIQRPDPYAHGVCPADQEIVIDAEARCSASGINIHFDGDDSAKVACMQDKDVQRLCGEDGARTRHQAYTQWVRTLQVFQANCTTDGGTFTFQDPTFREPQDDSFCLQAQPEIGSNMFEESLCNYHSLCPAVTVRCAYGCGGASN